VDLAQLILEYTKVLVWPAFAFVCVILFRASITAIFPRLKKAELPGGVKIDFQEAIDQAQQLKKDILTAPKPPEAQLRLATPIPLTEANARMIALGLQPSPSGLDLGPS
jgi:hypothetical protein